MPVLLSIAARKPCILTGVLPTARYESRAINFARKSCRDKYFWRIIPVVFGPLVCCLQCLAANLWTPATFGCPVVRLACAGRAMTRGVSFRKSPNEGAEHDCIQSDVVEGRSLPTAGGDFLGSFGVGRGPVALVRGQDRLFPGDVSSSAGPALGPAAAPAQPTPAATAEKLDTGDNAWVLTSSALVLMMTGPGLALFYCGLVRKKNVLSVMMQCVFLMCLMSSSGPSTAIRMAFGGSDDPTSAGLVRNDCDHLLHERGRGGVGATASRHDRRMSPSFPNCRHQPPDPHALPGHVLRDHPGADLRGLRRADEVQHDGGLHDPLGHAGLLSACATGSGATASSPTAARMRRDLLGGALDFAGGTVVHISSGVSALICALVLGKRLGYGSEPMPPHNLTYTAIGAACSGSAGSVSTPAAPWRPAAWRPAPSPPPTWRPPPAA